MTDQEKAEHERTIAELWELIQAQRRLIEELERQLAGGRKWVN